MPTIAPGSSQQVPQEFPWPRVLLVGGCFAGIVGFVALVPITLIVMEIGKNPTPAPAAQTPQLQSETNDPVPATAQLPGMQPTPVKPASGNPDETLRQAFDALGSRDKLDAIKAVQIKGKAHFVASKNINNITLTWQSTHKFKFVELYGNVNIETGFVLKGDEGWHWFGQTRKPMEKAVIAEQQLFAYSLSLSNLLPLKEKGFDLVKGGSLRVRERDCYSIIVKSAGRPDMILCFDQTTNLLAKSEFKGKLVNFGNFQPKGKSQYQDIFFECYYSNYKVVDGVNHWWKFEQYRNGAKHAELNLDNIQFFTQLTESLFSVPGT